MNYLFFFTSIKRKLPLLILIFTTFLAILHTTALPYSFAAVDIGPCTAGIGDKFNELCAVSKTTAPGEIIYKGIIYSLILAAIIALFFLVFGGFKWITSGGDKSKIDSARQTLVAAVIGLVLTFLSFFILSLVLQFFGLGFENLDIPAFRCPPGTSSQGGGLCF